MNGLLFPEPASFACLAADPPWLERGGGKSKRGADRHYPLVPTAEIPGVIRSSGLFLPAPNAHLWLWVTDNFLEDGLFVMRALGFRYVRCMVWVKMPDPGQVLRDLLERALTDALAPLAALKLALKLLRVATGLGQYLRGGHEICLFGVRGKGLDPSVRTTFRDVPSVVFGARGRHSEKPARSYEVIERVSKGPRVEFFARSRRPGWTSWGNDAAVTAPLEAAS